MTYNGLSTVRFLSLVALLNILILASVGGQAKTLMFVHISPEPDAIGETISTLKFAERVSSVELGAARTNKDSSDVKELKEQVLNFPYIFSVLSHLPCKRLSIVPAAIIYWLIRVATCCSSYIALAMAQH